MVEVELNIKLKCDKCGATAHNHYVIDDTYMDVNDEIDKLKELNDWEDGKAHLLCEPCQLKYDELR